jgi:hypothetical protein
VIILSIITEFIFAKNFSSETEFHEIDPWPGNRKCGKRSTCRVVVRRKHFRKLSRIDPIRYLGASVTVCEKSAKNVA